MNTTSGMGAVGEEHLGAQYTSPNVFDPKKLIAATWRRKYLVMIICVLAVGGTAYYTSKLPRAYAATASVMLENPTNPMSAQPQLTLTKAEVSKWHVVLAMGREVRKKTADLVKLKDAEAAKLRAEKYPNEVPLTVDTNPPPMLDKPTFEEQMISFPVVDGNAERAAKYANAWAEAFIEELSLRAQSPRQEARKVLEKKQRELQKEVQKREVELSMTVDIRELDLQRLRVAALTTKVNAKETDIEAQTAKCDEAAKRASDPLDLSDPSQPYVIQINDLKLKLKGLKKLYRLDSKEVIELESNIEELTQLAVANNIENSRKFVAKLKEANQALAILKNTRQVELLTLATLEKGAQQEKAAIEDLKEERRNLAEIDRQITQLASTEYLFVSMARIGDYAWANTAAIRPDWKKNIMTAGFASVFGALMLVFALELLDTKVKTPADLEQKVTGEIIGFIPYFKTPKTGLLEGDSLRNLQVKIDMILGARTDGLASVILVTSALSSEGKSFLASNIAFSFAKSGQRVLLIDGDFRKATLSTAQNCRGKPGLSEAICSGKFDPDETTETEVPGCSFLPAGKMQENDIAYVKPGSVENILAKLKAKYDVIVIDTVPVLALADACIMASLSDVTLLVVRSRQSKFVHVQRAAAMLKTAQPKALCVVVNAVQVADAIGEDYYFAVGGYGNSIGQKVPGPV